MSLEDSVQTFGSRQGSLVRRNLLRRFSAEREASFQQDFTTKMAPIRRFTTAAAIVMWLPYLWFDYTMAQADAAFDAIAVQVALIRLSVAVSLVLLHAATYQARFRVDARFADRLCAAGCFSAVLGTCAMSLVVPHPYDHLYFLASILLSTTVGLTVCSLLFRPAMVLAVLISPLCAAAIVWCMWFKDGGVIDTPARQYVWVMLVFFSTAIGVGCMLSAMLEVFARQSFLLREDLVRTNTSLGVLSAAAQERLEAVIELKERLRNEAEDRSQEKSRFISNAVHDLRQPVQALVTLLDPLEVAVERADTPSSKSLIDLSRQATQNLQNQLNNILDVSRLESGAVPARLRRFQLPALLADIVAGWPDVTKGDAMQLALHDTTPPHAPQAYSDPDFIRRIVNNLISNSFKYQQLDRPEGTQVTVHCELIDQTLQVSVQDNGIGMEPALIESGQIFEPFFQANNHLVQGEKGVGLGLAIIKALVALLPDHTIQVQSQLGVGSCFKLTVPTAHPDALSDVDELEPLQMTSPTADLAGMYVVVVDDDDLVRQSLLHLLDSWAVLCETCRNATEFKQLAASLEREPDLVLCDYRLPDNRTAVDIIRLAHQHQMQLPFVLITGESLDFSPVPELSGFTILRKPVTAQTLHDALRAVWLARTSTPEAATANDYQPLD